MSDRSLPVTDVGLAVDFYGRLGFQVSSHNDGFAIVHAGGDEVQLWHHKQPVPVSVRVRVGDAPGMFPICEAHEAVPPGGTLRRQRWGTSEFSVVDPDGNVVTLFSAAVT